MKRDQNEVFRKSSWLKWIIITMLLIILILLVLLFFKGKKSNNKTTNTSMNETSKISTSTTEGSSYSSTSETSSEEDSYPYSVSFGSNRIYTGEEYDGWGYTITTYSDTDKIVVASGPKDYPDPTAHMGQVASLVPQTIKTQVITVLENGTKKEVKVNTELKIDDAEYSVSSDFFTPFNGNDTKVYAYYMDNGHIALAFTSKSETLDQRVVYQAIEFTLDGEY